MPRAEISISAIPFDSPIGVEAHGKKIVLVRTNGLVFAFEDVCPHAFWPLSAGTFTNGVIECPGHGWEFQVATGECRESPRYCLTPISATVQGEFVLLEWEERPADGVRNGTPAHCPRVAASNAPQASQPQD